MLHWIDGLLTAEMISRLRDFSKAKIVWLMQDLETAHRRLPLSRNL